jgi:hypothetical protein
MVTPWAMARAMGAGRLETDSIACLYADWGTNWPTPVKSVQSLQKKRLRSGPRKLKSCVERSYADHGPGDGSGVPVSSKMRVLCGCE